jgi:hypothetical protein
MNFRAWLESVTRVISVAEDQFLHFTTESRADQILSDGVLKMNPPYPKFGTDSVDAISVTYGQWVPGTQVTHVKATDRDPLVAILFKTNVVPYAGYPEEVKWNRDVKLIDPQIIPIQKARAMLTYKTKDDDYEIHYDG